MNSINDIAAAADQIMEIPPFSWSDGSYLIAFAMAVSIMAAPAILTTVIGHPNRNAIARWTAFAILLSMTGIDIPVTVFVMWHVFGLFRKAEA